MAGYSYPNGRGRLGFAFRGNAKDGAEARDGWGNSEGGNNQSGTHYARDRPSTQESINNVQNAASDGGRTGFPGGIFRRQKFDHGGSQGGANEMNSNGWNSPAGGRYEPLPDNVSTEPTLITAGGWTRPSRAGWALPPEEPLVKASPSPGFPNPYQPKNKGTVTPTIDSRKAAKKYGGMLV
ncbi:hypothetical protein COCNU_12G001890 [Cocos nucifera]|uniref:Uncharacterized protein n=1 Tax=Cocos nucifera TaxID=13894 RepID=A0A8K0IR05_COCNU|nr:hypothetical protein COCNU_12G001890 [Cocos nucifera]